MRLCYEIVFVFNKICFFGKKMDETYLLKYGLLVCAMCERVNRYICIITFILIFFFLYGKIKKGIRKQRKWI